MPLTTDLTGDLGVAQCKLLLTRQGFLFREQPTHDYGIDAQIETLDPSGYASGKLIALQIKTGESYFKEISGDRVIYRGTSVHRGYWLRHSLPVVLVLYHPVSGETIWAEITRESAEETAGGWRIAVPRANRLEAAKGPLEEIAGRQSEYQRKFSALLLAKPWMEAVRRGDQVILEAEEWVNKSSGRGSVKLSILSGGEERAVIDWPFVFFGLMDYGEAFRRLFPWADFQVDDGEYWDEEWDAYVEENCPYDSETGTYLFDDQILLREFSQYRKSLPAVRPSRIAAGEVAFYRLVLTLNQVGESFLTLDRFLETGAVFSIGGE